MTNDAESKGQPEVTFTIDGVTFTTADRKQTAAALLELAGVEPGDHDLARVLGRGEIEKRYADGETVQITPDAKYVTVFTGATPVV